jgi:hypothetical protein
MKIFLLSVGIFLFSFSSLTAQNEVKVDEKYKGVCKGTCFLQNEFDSEGVTEQEITFMRKKTVKLYMFKEEGKAFPSMDIYDFKGKHISGFKTVYDEERNYMYIQYKSPYYNMYKVKLRFPDNEKSNATVVLCYKSPTLVIGSIHQPKKAK